jgi:hypothetical protein
VPLVGREADDVYADIQRAGYAIADGRPASAHYDGLIDGNACASSRTFVRADTDVGWAFICVDPPADAYRRISGAFEEAPMLMGPPGSTTAAVKPSSSGSDGLLMPLVSSTRRSAHRVAPTGVSPRRGFVPPRGGG